MLRKLRIILAAIFFAGVTLLFLDFTGTLHSWLGWMAKVQLLPAILAVNVVTVAVLLLLTFLFGRIYCSVVCPLGIMQDVISWVHGRRKKKNRYRFTYSPAKKWLRYPLLVLFIVALFAGAHSIAVLIAPYSAYGRIAANLLAPLYQLGNNFFAWIVERAGSYAFYSVDVWIKSVTTFIIAAVTFVFIAVLAWKNGRTWCNTVCPVGTFLGFISRHSLLAPVIDKAKCTSCGLCSRQCKASCINQKEHEIDYSRCVVCMDCLESCREGAIHYALRRKKAEDLSGADKPVSNKGRRAFLTSAAIAGASTVLKAQEMKVDGGLAEIARAEKPQRSTPIVPAGSLSLKNFNEHCTSCQLCVSACPDNVLRPSSSLMTLMQPEMSYERGYCRPECTRCSEVCPAGAIRPISKEEKSSVQIGHAVIDLNLCVVNTDEVSCGNCSRHCPSGAISLVRRNPDHVETLMIPVVDEEKCIGCGACENLCPARPFTAIHVEGHEIHKEI